MVVDLAIEDHQYSVILISHRLVAANKIDNCKASVSEKDMGEFVFIDPFTVRTSVLKRPGEGIRLKDVHVSDKVRLLGDPETMVAVATFAKVEEETVAVPGAEAVTPTATEPEISVERGKKEEEAADEKKKK